ncbi:hypothetical protein B0T25DRAFT_581806 [Lasiosphaeria hispida]|uniref:FAS1 domain-containing protein n=1 Tax=Lasiosphaeria hispida TaxID=260671 RepID=A0AAJ0HD70_9PEZI|nr:hypothetical protein B0T25DRAFT_581806 [Lasiosphaeria hispida]
MRISIAILFLQGLRVACEVPQDYQTVTLDDFADDLVSTIQETPNLSVFADVLDQNKDVLMLDNSTEYLIFAPSNSADAQYYLYSQAAVSGSPDTLALGGEGDTEEDKRHITPALALLFIDRGRSPPDLAVQAATLRTNLTDPRYVNLGPGIPANIVSEPAPGTGHRNIMLTAGLGIQAKILLSMIDYSQGTIQESDSLLTLPEPFDVTLRKTEGTGFLDALKRLALLEGINSTSKITAFVPIDPAFTGKEVGASALQRHILPDFLGYTPNLIDGQTHRAQDGSQVTVSYKQGAYYANNAKIVKANVITKNGVIHYVDTLIESAESSTSSTPDLGPTSGASPGQKSIGASFEPFLLGVAALISVLVVSNLGV